MGERKIMADIFSVVQGKVGWISLNHSKCATLNDARILNFGWLFQLVLLTRRTPQSRILGTYMCLINDQNKSHFRALLFVLFVLLKSSVGIITYPWSKGVGTCCTITRAGDS